MNNNDDNTEDVTGDDFEIEEMRTKETSFSLDQIAKTCSPLQYVRELTKNAIEAIPKGEEGKIFWTYDKDELEESGIHKLACIDSGSGMDGEEERLYMNNMYSSIKEQTTEGNFGIGAKVAALSRSPKGLIYKSYKNGNGYLAELCQHPKSAKYGLRQQIEPDGSLTPYLQIPFNSIPEELREINADSGTMVTMIGKTEDEDTFTNPPEGEQGKEWLSRYLNGRFFNLPERISLKVEYRNNPEQDFKPNYKRRTIKGMRYYLGKYQQESGVVDITGARMHWWILNDEFKKINYITNWSHTGTLFSQSNSKDQEEIYDLEVGNKTNKSRLHRCGIIHLLNRMVIYAEPTTKGIFADPGRTEVYVAPGKKSPWNDWADEFFQNLPPEIKKLENDASEKASDSDINIQAYDMLKDWLKDFKIPKYRMKNSGELELTPPVDLGGAPDSGLTAETTNEKPGNARNNSGSRGNRYSDFTTDDGERGKEIRSDQFIPSVNWVSPEDHPHLDDRPASYIRVHNRLLINKEYRGFTSWVDSVHQDKGGGKPGSRSIVDEKCQLHWQVHLCETVMRVQMLKKDGKTWRMDEVDSALSELGLTTAVSGIGHLDKVVRTSVGHAIGKVERRREEALVS